MTRNNSITTIWSMFVLCPIMLSVLILYFSFLHYHYITPTIAEAKISPKVDTPTVQTSISSYTYKAIPDVDSTVVPVLMYHHIKEPLSPKRDRIDYGLSVTPSSFNQQMSSLASHGFSTIAVDQIFKPDQNKKISLTFDDGYKDIITNAYPIMQQYNYTGTVFIITAFIGRDGYLSSDDIKQLLASGWTLGSHTVSHPELNRLNSETASLEINSSKSQLESIFDVHITTICYPAGKYSKEIMDQVENAGYAFATTTKYGVQNSLPNRFQIKRLRISGSDDLISFERKIY